MPDYKTTFNYLLTHKVIPHMYFENLDLFYDTVITSPQNMQIFMKNCVTAAADMAKDYSDIEPVSVYEWDKIEEFSIAPFGDSIEKGVISAIIPNSKVPPDSVAVAFPFAREKAGYFTMEQSSDPMTGKTLYILGEWTPSVDNYKHSNYGEVDISKSVNFPNRVIEIVYGKEKSDSASGPQESGDNFEDDTISGDYNRFIIKLLHLIDESDEDDLVNDKNAVEIIKTPLFVFEEFYDILQNKEGDILFCIRIRDGEQRLPEIFYSGGKNALLRRRLDQYVVLDEVHENIREALGKIDEVLVAEFYPNDGNDKIDKDRGIVREYTVPIRHLDAMHTLESIEEIRKDGYPMFAFFTTLLREHMDMSIKDVVPEINLPDLAAVLVHDEDYELLDKYTSEGLSINERVGIWFKEWQPTPVFYTTVAKVWSSMKDPVKMLKYLVSKGADLNKQSAEGDSPVGNQCYSNGKVEIIKALLECGADPNAAHISDGFLFCPLQLVLFPEEYDDETHKFTPFSDDSALKAKLLINAGADVNAGLHAVKHSNIEMEEESYVESDAVPLGFALTYGSGKQRIEIVKLMLEKGADVEGALNAMEKKIDENMPENAYALYEIYSDKLGNDIPQLSKYKDPEKAKKFLEICKEEGLTVE